MGERLAAYDAQHHADALTWLERHIPDGIRLVALALAETARPLPSPSPGHDAAGGEGRTIESLHAAHPQCARSEETTGPGEVCSVCDGSEIVTEAAHDPGCDGSCRNCPVPVPAPCPACAPPAVQPPETRGEEE
jgi:hypothetical protein